MSNRFSPRYWSLIARRYSARLKKPLYKNSLYLITDTALTSGFGFIFWMVIARFYDQVDVGFGSAAISAITLIGMLSLCGFNVALIRFLPQFHKPLTMINTCLTVSGAISIIVAVVFVAGLDIWSPALSFIRSNLIFASVFVVLTAFQAFAVVLRSIYIARRKANQVLITDLITSMLKIPLAILLVFYFRSFSIAAAWGIALAVSVLVSLFVLVPKIERGYKPVPTLDKKILGNLLNYSSGSYFASLLSQTTIWVLPLIVVNRLDSWHNAVFYIVWTIASLLSAISASAAHSLFAEGANYKDKFTTNILKTIKFTYLLLVPAIIILLLAGNLILGVFGENYSEFGLKLLRILAVAALPLSINMIYHSILRVENRIKELCLVSGLPTLLVLVGSYFCISEIGLSGIGYTWLGTQVLMAIYTVFSIRKYAKKEFSQIR